jgi:exodeoxyribonuclease V
MSEIVLTDDQQRAMDGALAWFTAKGAPVYVLAGVAGSGKTFLLGHLAEQLRQAQPNIRIRFLAPTGKAARVLRSKQCHNATTIHSLVYRPVIDEMTGRVARWVKREKDPCDLDGAWNFDLLIADEASMVNEQLAADLLSYNVPILACGDPGQLPPVDGVSPWMTREPDAKLLQIVRTKAGNPIIALSMQLRRKQRLEIGSNDGLADVRMLVNYRNPSDEVLAHVIEADQLIVGTNAMRLHWNGLIRAAKGFDSKVPVVGDKLVCLRNSDLARNGETFLVLSAAPLSRAADVTSRAFRMALTLRDYDDPSAEQFLITFDGSQFDWADDGKSDRKEWGWGFALSVHKAQGSEFGHVVLLDESHSGAAREYPWRWGYTGVTRAKDRLTVFTSCLSLIVKSTSAEIARAS